MQQTQQDTYEDKPLISSCTGRVRFVLSEVKLCYTHDYPPTTITKEAEKKFRGAGSLLKSTLLYSLCVRLVQELDPNAPLRLGSLSTLLPERKGGKKKKKECLSVWPQAVAGGTQLASPRARVSTAGSPRALPVA